MEQNTEQNTSRAPLLDVRGLSVDYLTPDAAVHAVETVNLRLRRGEILGLAGESGSGKSTLAYAIARLLRPPATITVGEVWYHPRSDPSDRSLPAEPVNLADLSVDELRVYRWTEIAVVFQSAMNALNPVMTIGAQIMDTLRVHRPAMGRSARIQRARELLELVGIAPDRIGSYPHELSGGMRQRAAIAIALALSPELIIMDEPTTALDVVMQRDILAEILRLQEQLGFSVIFITHDLSLLLELADRVAIMYAGRIVEEASQHDLYAHARHPYSFGLINSFPTLHGARRRAVGIPGTPPDLRAVPQGCAFHPRCPLAIAACRVELPVLQSATDSSDQQVACHLYNPRFSTTSPTNETMSASYEALAETSALAEGTAEATAGRGAR